MKVTGIIRRVDQLGRIVLPMEMRKYMNIAEGTLLEMVIDGDIIKLQKYSVLHNLKDVADEILNSLPKCIDAIILDEDNVVSTTKNLLRLKGKSYNKNLFKIEQSCVVRLDSKFYIGENSFENYYIQKIIKDGDFRGFILIKCETQDCQVLLNLISNFILNKI